MIDPSSDRAVYRQIADDLRNQVVGGHIGPGEWLQSAPRLAQEYGVAVETVRRALRLLHAEEVVVVEPNYGARVPEPVSRAQVSVPRGSTVIGRPATPDERAEYGIAEGGHILVVSLGGRVRAKYAEDRTELRIS